MILDGIVQSKKREVEHMKAQRPLRELKEAAASLPLPRDFKAAITSSDCSVIAEVKRSSPSKGRIREDFDPAAIARIYEKSGAAAISVLTDAQYFEGRKSYLSDIRKVVAIPLLRKDFIIDSYQIYETRIIGGDAILLIATILREEVLAEFVDISESLGLFPLVEVHTREDLIKAIAAGATIIGINNRNLHTFTTDIAVTKNLASQVPADRVIISESGITTREDIETLMKAGICSFLVGEALMRAENTEKKLKELLGRTE